MTADLEHDFAAWADRRDAAALTRVFDATAGRLVLLAAHLAGPGAIAEDLVQATFLAAMRRADTWDRRRPVWPWLAAILRNEARMERRSRRRKCEVPVAGDDLAEDRDPASLAASTEVVARIVEAIDALPARYLQVLRLRLVHGLCHGAIARALELPVGTVRARVHRGLARLRDALPSGVAVVLATLATDADLLSAVRDRVRDESSKLAPRPAPFGPSLTAGLTASTTIGWTMKKTIAACAVVVALLLGVRVLQDPGEAPVPVRADDAAVRSAVFAQVGAVDGEGADSAASRTPIEVPSSPAWPLTVTVLDGDGDRPLAGARVEVGVMPHGAVRPPEAWIAEGPTDAAGLFTCSLDELRACSVLRRATSLLVVRATITGHTIGHTYLAVPRSDEPRGHTAELTLFPCIELTGRVVDPAGTPVAGAGLAFAGRSPSVSNLDEVSGPDGRFVLRRRPRELGLWSGLAGRHPRIGSGSTALPRIDDDVPLGSVLELSDLVLLPHACVHGTVVLGDGTPLGGHPVTVHELPDGVERTPEAIASWLQGDHAIQPPRPRFVDGRLEGAGVPVKTEMDGTVDVRGLAAERDYAVVVVDSCQRPTPTVARADGEPFRLVVERQLARIAVRDADGESLPGVSLRADGWPPGAARRHVGGAYFPLDADDHRLLLSPFGWRWELAPDDEIVRPEPVTHVALPGVDQVRFDVVVHAQEAFGALRIAVEYGGGGMLGDFEIELRARDGSAVRSTSARFLDEDRIVRELPAGRWVLRIGAGKKPDQGLDLWTRGLHEREVDVRAGETAYVRIAAPPGGLAAFDMAADVPPEDGRWRGLKIREAGTSGDATLDFAGQLPPHVPRGPLHGTDRWTRYGLRFVVAQSFARGRHDFVVEAEGYLPARCEVVVEADRVVATRVTLRRR